MLTLLLTPKLNNLLKVMVKDMGNQNMIHRLQCSNNHMLDQAMHHNNKAIHPHNSNIIGHRPIACHHKLPLKPQPAAGGYSQQTGQPVSAYGQQTAGYAQTVGLTTGYGQYPTTIQPDYTDPPAAATNVVAYYQGQVDPSAYAAAAGQQAYSVVPVVAQQGYVQAAPTQPG
ncbi:hypothetical protein BVRB_9g214980 [Beta vulgaris subsp. vulgaris]|nr:hypothetical protein BVRB_9g214980 [Beta vulgaris subsp. vulgaris]